MSLCWYAQAASETPLLQYLAFYQCIEFYFPVFFDSEAQRRVRSVLKDPTFRPDRDSDVARVLTLARESMTGAADERSMIRATVQQCVGRSDLKAFLEAWDRREAALTSKCEGVTDIKIPLKNDAADLRAEAAERIYDIRCRIVHTKVSSKRGGEVLLPFSTEERRLEHDIDLVRFVARQVLISTSNSL